MNNKKRILYIIILLIVVIFTNLLSIKITSLFTSSQEDMDYQKLELEIKDYDIDYYTIYSKDISYEYKVYKINNSYKGDSIDEIKIQLENSKDWSKKKFYEYIMMKFYERIDGEITEIDRENLYYYNKGGIYAIIDVKNAKLYYLKNNIIDYHNDYNEILEIKTNQNGYYCHKKVYKTNNSYKNVNIDTKETEYEVGVFDCDKDVLYYYWISIWKIIDNINEKGDFLDEVFASIDNI